MGVLYLSFCRSPWATDFLWIVDWKGENRLCVRKAPLVDIGYLMSHSPNRGRSNTGSIMLSWCGAEQLVFVEIIVFLRD